MVKTKSKITQVTVFTDRAQIQRSAKEKLTKGEHLLLFDDLPQDIEQNSIQVNGEGKALIKDVKFKTKELVHVYEKEQFLNLAADNNFILFLEHDAYSELCTVKHTEKGIRLEQTYSFNEVFS